MNTFNIYLIGVGGQGIGLLAETILRAIDYAEIRVKSVDTHGLAQRGGTVISQIRMGENVFSPLIPPFSTDLILSLELHEAYRALMSISKPESTLVCYDTSWQPLSVRKGDEKKVQADNVLQAAKKMQIKAFIVKDPNLGDPRMQNMALLKKVASEQLIPGLNLEHYVQALEDLMKGPALEANKKILLG